MYEHIEATYPHLIGALQRGCNLSRADAVGAIYAHRYGRRIGAVNACSVACATIRRAVTVRNDRRPVRLAA